MKPNKGLKYCRFIPDGSSNLETVFCLLKWILFCWFKFYRWLIIVETKAAGKNAGKHRDVYIFTEISSAKNIIKQIKESEKREDIYLLDCLNGGIQKA